VSASLPNGTLLIYTALHAFISNVLFDIKLKAKIGKHRKRKRQEGKEEIMRKTIH
jgi:hypothetical protein